MQKTTRDKKELRTGFTTGTCAAAASMAAAQALLWGEKPQRVSLELPGKIHASFQVLWLRERKRQEGSSAQKGHMETDCLERGELCAVRKDAGDDPDVTDGALVCAFVSLIPQSLPKDGVYCDCRGERKIYIAGGRGIGRVTKKGLKCPVGYPAINPVPRMMIADAVRKAAENCRQKQDLYVEISIPGGERLAEKTFNSHLGIEGGISVLGTTGIVNPMSEEALKETIRLDIQVRKEEGRTLLAVAPGNYGEAFLREQMGLSMESFVRCSNFVGETFGMMAEAGIKEVLFAGHLGKLIKVAGGVMNTHSKYGDRRMEILWDCLEEALDLQSRETAENSVSKDGKAEKKLAFWENPERLRKTVLSMNTADEAAEFLREQGILEPVMKIVTERIKNVLTERFAVSTEVIVFSGSAGILGMTQGARQTAERLRRMFQEAAVKKNTNK